LAAKGGLTSLVLSEPVPPQDSTSAAVSNNADTRLISLKRILLSCSLAVNMLLFQLAET
jgi:hypothetical protein